jgi:hypothetical protein
MTAVFSVTLPRRMMARKLKTKHPSCHVFTPLANFCNASFLFVGHKTLSMPAEWAGAKCAFRKSGNIHIGNSACRETLERMPEASFWPHGER